MKPAKETGASASLRTRHAVCDGHRVPKIEQTVQGELRARALRQVLDRQGYCYLPGFAQPTADNEALIALAAQLGPLLPLSESGGEAQVVEVAPCRRPGDWVDPFDREEALGWHNDFTSRRVRPRFTLAWLTRADPKGPLAGAWRIARVGDVLTRLQRRDEGARLLSRLRQEALPFSYTGEGQPDFFTALDGEGEGYLRFYGRGIRQGCGLAWGEVPRGIEFLVRSVEGAADAAGRRIAALPGDLLVTDNRRTLHDRLPQTVSGRRPLRQSRLCFVQ